MIETVADLVPAASEVCGWNLTVTVQVAPMLRVVPQFELTLKSAGFVPVRVAALIGVNGTFPVLVSVYPVEGSKKHANIWSIPVPGQFRVTVPKAKLAGVKVAAETGATPVPERDTGELSTVAPFTIKVPL